MDTPDLAAYRTANDLAGFFLLPESGYLRVSGADRLDFIQRQTSNDVRLLQSDRPLLSVLTSPTARILDVLYLCFEPDAIGLVTLPGFGLMTFQFLRSRIFFMDKVTVNDASREFSQFDLLGPQAEPVLSQLSSSQLEGMQILALDRAFGLGFRLLVSAEKSQALEQALRSAGTACLDEDVYQLLRIESGLPRAGAEISDAYTPLEVGLESAVSSSKGCYTGQEVIARQITYDKVTQKLCGLKLSSPAHPPVKLRAEDKAAGTLTSFARSPRFGLVALAVIHRSYALPGTQLVVGETPGDKITAEVVPLPFADN